MMKRLSFLKKIAKPIRVKRYVTFIECCFLHHLSTIHGHLTKSSKKSIDSIIQLTSWFGDCTFNDVDTLSSGCMRARCLRMFATQGNNPIFEPDRLPPGHYRMIKARVALHRNCYRVQAIKMLNNLQHKTFSYFVTLCVPASYTLIRCWHIQAKCDGEKMQTASQHVAE